MNRSTPPVSLGTGGLDTTEEWVVTTSRGLVTKIEALDRATQRRTDVSAHAGLSAGNRDAAQTEEAVVTTSNLAITKIEKIDRATQQRTQLSCEESAGLVAAIGLACGSDPATGMVHATDSSGGLYSYDPSTRMTYASDPTTGIVYAADALGGFYSADPVSGTAFATDVPSRALLHF
jgi:hypothetical protein